MIDISKLPKFTICLDQLLHACEIKSIMKNCGVKYYCYIFMCNDETMKIGMSADNDWLRGSYGERIYRQAFHIPGWPSRPAKSTPGFKDMQKMLPHFPSINKNDVKIIVFDMTGYPFESSYNPSLEVNDLERQLMDGYENQYGFLPVGNIIDERERRKGRVTDKLFGSLFDEE
jgi:hypothetical protein